MPVSSFLLSGLRKCQELADESIVSQEVRKPQIGGKIAGYTILSKLGSGGMGDVYLCDDKALSRRIAVKIMHAIDTAADPEAATRFILEGKALAKLAHPNIVSVFGLGEDNGFLYIAMEHIAGRSLHHLARERRLTIREMISIISDIAAGLDHAHSHGIIHRDIKPANILIDGFGRAKLIDFGIAKSVGGNLVGSEGVRTKTGAVIGTLNYIAPELFRGEPPSPSTDIYALGLLFYEMLTGRTPFKGESQFQTMEMIRGGQLDIPENLRVVLPEEAWKVLYEMIDKEPLRRPQTASAAAAKLSAIQFPNLPAYFNSDLLSIRIDNVNELQARLEELAVDPAEWGFILSLAVRKQAERPNENKLNHEEGESTQLIEAAGLVVPLDILNEAVEAYQQDLSTMMTMRKAEQLSGLVAPEQTDPPQVKRYVPQTEGFQSQSVLAEAEPAKARSHTFEIAVASILAVGLGFFAWQKFMAVDKAGPAAASQTGDRRRAGVQVDAPTQKVPAAGAASAASSFAMVIEPPTDAWPPVIYRQPVVGEVAVWKWKRRVSEGVNDLGSSEIFERVTFDSLDQGLMKVKIERIKKEGGAELSAPAGFEWYTPGFATAPNKALRSNVYGSFTSRVVGQLNAIFPLRRGKEVQFEIVFEPRAEVGLKPEILLAASYRSNCTIRDQVELTTALGPGKTVKIDCALKSDRSELSETLYWNLERGLAVRRDRRFVSSANGSPIETIAIGELISHTAADLRQPAQQAPSR